MKTKTLSRVSSGITFVVLAALTLSLLLPVVAAAKVSIGRVRLDDPGNYLFGDSGVTAKFKFHDDGTTLKIIGHAKGLIPDGRVYASLIYDIFSSDEGDFACEPSFEDPFDPDPDNIFLTMFVGFWDVKKSGVGTLKVTNIEPTFGGALVYVPLSKIGTISIRDGTVPGPFGPGTGPAAVVACGDVVVHP